MRAGIILRHAMLTLVLAGQLTALDLSGSAGITRYVLLPGRREGLCQLMDLILQGLGRQHKSWL